MFVYQNAHRDICVTFKSRMPVQNPEYVITSIHNSIMHSNSLINSITFERLKQQLSDPSTYRKNGTSPLDNLFVLE